MTRINELLQQRAALIADVRKELDAASAEKRTHNEESVQKMEAEITRIEATIAAEERQQAREKSAPAAPGFKNGEQKIGRDSEDYRSALWAYMRDGQLRGDLNVGTDSAGGYLVPTAFENSIITAVTNEEVIRQLADVRMYSLDTDIPVKSGRASFAFIAEKGAYPEAQQTYGKLALKAYKAGGVIKVSEELLQDSVANIESEVNGEIVYARARLEENKFALGSGSGEPTGFIGSATTGVTTAAAAKISGDDIIDLFHALKPGYRRNATWLMNDAIAKTVRKVKNDSGTYGSLDYVWQPGLQAGNPDTILGRPVRYQQDMDSALTVGKKVIAFGDFKYYRIADRLGLSVQRLNELYAGTGQIGFRATFRVDGLLTLAEAVQLMVMHA